MNHIDLFSGIAGFALAAQEVWGEDYHNLFFCDNNAFCQEVLRKNFGKDSLIYGDIRLVSKERFIADTNGNGQPRRSEEVNATETDKQAFSNTQECDLLTGGFPCQPFSQAGKRKGTNDDRHLWPEMLRVIREFKPTWIIAENVRGLLTIEGGLVFEQVCLDLERESYEVQPFVIPAVAVNAPHRRDRVWIVCHSKSQRGERQEKQDIQRKCEDTDSNGGIVNAPDTGNEGLQRGRQTRNEDSNGRKYGNEQLNGCSRGFNRKEWERSWLEVALETCSRDGRVDDGVSERIYGFTPAKHRVERLKSLGNAIVPQVAIEIMKAIKYSGDYDRL